MVTATLVRDLPRKWQRASQKLWHLTGELGDLPTYVVSSAVMAMFTGPETYLFPADADGEVTSFIEMQGSYRGGLDHEEAIGNAGWTVAEQLTT